MKIRQAIKKHIAAILCLGMMISTCMVSPAEQEDISGGAGEGITVEAGFSAIDQSEECPVATPTDCVPGENDPVPVPQPELNSDADESATTPFLTSAELETDKEKVAEYALLDNSWYRSEKTPKSAITSIAIEKNGDLPVNIDWWMISEVLRVYVEEGGKLTIVGCGEDAIKLDANGCGCFRDFTNVTSITGLENIDASETTDFSCMFANDEKLTGLDLTSWDFSKAASLAYMFYGDSSLTAMEFPKKKADAVKGTLKSMRALFYGCSSLKSVQFNTLDTSGVTDMRNLFYGCSSLVDVMPVELETGAVTDMAGMFSGCSSMEYFTLTEMDTSSVQDMSYMFEGIGAGELDLSNMNTSSVTNMKCMFLDAKAKKIDLNGINMQSVTDTSFMFYNCSNLVSIIDEANFDTSKVVKDTNMFAKCSQLKGERGTAYSVKHAGKLYARLDQSLRGGYFSKFED